MNENLQQSLVQYDRSNYQRYTIRAEADKAIHSLKGMLLGLTFDKQIKVAALNELIHWCRYHQESINKHSLREYLYSIQVMGEAEQLNIETLQDLYWCCQQFEEANIYYKGVTTDLQIMLGICHAILAGGELTDQQLFALQEWLEDHGHLHTYYPYDELYTLLLCVTSNSQIDHCQGKRRLKGFLYGLVKIVSSELKAKIKQEVEGLNISGIYTANPKLRFDGQSFCFTGISARAPRRELVKIVENLGGVFKLSVSKGLDYLIVGDWGNPAWAFACYGRKVEQAMNFRKRGQTISIVHEFDFWEMVDGLRAY